MTRPNHPTPAFHDAELLLAGLSDLEPEARMAAEGRLIEELQRVMGESYRRAAESAALLAAVLEAIAAKTARPE